MKIYMLRHGQTIANKNYTYCGTTDLPLTMEGVRQLVALRTAGDYPPSTGLDFYTSGKLRCEQTLRALYWNPLNRFQDSRFEELHFGIFENKSYEELKDTKEYQEWISGDNLANVIPGGESGYQMQARVLEGFEDLLKKGRDCMVICHGGVIATVFMHYFPDTELNWYEIQPDNGKGFLFEFEDGKPVRWEKIPRVQQDNN